MTNEVNVDACKAMDATELYGRLTNLNENGQRMIIDALKNETEKLAELIGVHMKVTEFADSVKAEGAAKGAAKGAGNDDLDDLDDLIDGSKKYRQIDTGQSNVVSVADYKPVEDDELGKMLMGAYDDVGTLFNQ
jgi:hypothetical protein